MINTMSEVRAILGMSLDEFAEALGCARRSVAYYESGRRAIPQDIADQLRHMLRTYLDTRTRMPVRRAVEDRFQRLAPGFSGGAVPDGYLALVEKCLTEVEKAVPASLLGRPLAARLSAPVGRLVLDIALDPSVGASPEAEGFRQWLRERAARLTEDSRTTCARCGGPGASLEISGWAWPLCGIHAIKRKEIRDESRAA
jgi:AcrR family transcriptional regulator